MLAVGVGDAEGVGVGEDAGVGAGVVCTGVGFGSATPLFHRSFLPLLMQVYFFPLAVAVIPIFLHVSPAFTAAVAFIGAINNETEIIVNRIFLMAS